MSDVKEKLDEVVEDVVEAVKDKAEAGLKEQVKKDLYLNSKTKGVHDAIQERLVSRKLLVFLTATGLLIGAGLDPDTWGMIAMFYIGGQSAIDAVQVWRHGR